MSLGKSRIFLLLSVSFIVGVFFGQWLGRFVVAFLAMAFVMLITIWGFSTRLPDGQASSNRKLFLVVGFLGLALLAGAWRWQASFSIEHRSDFIGQLNGQKAELTGTVVREPDIRDDRTNLTVSPQGFTGRVLLSMGRSLTYQYGDVVRFSGKFQEPFESEEFSYKNYLSRYEVYSLVYYPKVEKLATGQGGRLKTWLLGIKGKFQDVITAILPLPHSSLMLGLILGLKRSLPQALSDALIACGVSHIVVISGYNISIITRNILKTRSWLGRRAALALSLFLVLGFVTMTGAEASSVRAAVMGLLVVVALNVGRIYDIRTALTAAAAVMVFLNPKILAFDIGFQLSFMATAGLVFLAPVFDRWFSRVPDFLSLRASLSSSLAAILFTLPLQMFYFDQLSLVAPLVNVLILWVVPYAMLFGFFAAVAGVVYLPVGHFLAAFGWLCLEYVIQIVKFFAGLPFAARSIAVGLWWMALYYASLASWVWGYRATRGITDQLEYEEKKL